MIDQVMVPLDGSEFGESVLPTAVAVATAADAGMTLVHVHVAHVPEHLLSNTQYHFEGVDLGEYDRRDRDGETRYLEGVAGRAERSLGRPVETVLLEGSVPDALVEHLRAAGSGLVVMATHGRTGLSRAWLGSVADGLVRHAPWPVLLVRPSSAEGDGAPPDSIDHILLPLDGSACAEGALPTVAALAVATGAELELVQVLQPSGILGTRVLPMSLAALQEARRRAEGYLAEVAERLEERGIECSTRVVEHVHPARGILEEAREGEPAMVAMATHGYGGVSRAVLGSVADKVLRGIDRPLLVVGPGVLA